MSAGPGQPGVMSLPRVSRPGTKALWTRVQLGALFGPEPLTWPPSPAPSPAAPACCSAACLRGALPEDAGDASGSCFLLQMSWLLILCVCVCVQWKASWIWSFLGVPCIRLPWGSAHLLGYRLSLLADGIPPPPRPQLCLLTRTSGLFALQDPAMTLNNVTMRQGPVGMQPQQQRWSIPADGRHLMVQKEPPQYGQHHCQSAAPEDPCRRSWSSDSTDSVISSESGNTYYRVVLIGEQGVGKSTLANIFAGVHDSMDSDCEVLGGRWPSPSGLLSAAVVRPGRARGRPCICRAGSGRGAFLALAGEAESPEKPWHGFSG